jgi:hypothetical protein
MFLPFTVQALPVSLTHVIPGGTSDLSMSLADWISKQSMGGAYGVLGATSVHCIPMWHLRMETRASMRSLLDRGLGEVYVKQDTDTDLNLMQAACWMGLPLAVRSVFSDGVLHCQPVGPRTWWSYFLCCFSFKIVSVLGASAKSVVFHVSHTVLNILLGSDVIVAKVAVDPDWTQGSNGESVEAICGRATANQVNRRLLSQEAKWLLALSSIPQVPKLVALAQWQTTCVLLSTGGGISARQLVQLQGKGFSLDVLQEIAANIVRILQAIHAEGIVHLDVSPSNIVQRSGNSWFLVDFASALRVGQIPPPDLPFTYAFASNNLRFRTSVVCENDDFEALRWSLVFLHAPNQWERVALGNPDQELTQMIVKVHECVNKLIH